MFEPPIPKQRMAGRRGDDNGSDVIAVNKFVIEFTVEQKNKLVLRVSGGDPLQRFMGKPADAFRFIFQKQAGVDGYEQVGYEFEVLGLLTRFKCKEYREIAAIISIRAAISISLLHLLQKFFFSA